MNLQQPGIYLITHKESGKRYIGSAVRFDRRWNQHRHYLSKNTHCNNHLQNIYDKYGINSLIFSVVEVVSDKTKLLEREQWYLDTWEPEINILKVAGSPLGRKHSEEAKAKISTAHKGKKLSEGTKAKMSVAKMGVCMSEYTKTKISEAKRGIKLSEKHKTKMSEVRKGKHHRGSKGYTVVSTTKVDGSVNIRYQVQIGKKYYGQFRTEQEAVDKVREIRDGILTV
jgi:group I intron endonuclease